MSVVFDPIQYKIRSKANWNIVAPQYHNGWASLGVGPFKSTQELVKIADISPNDKVLDLGCGTGVVSKLVSKHLDNNGMIIGVDLSRTALVIAKQYVMHPKSFFIEMDAEYSRFNLQFDKILCQYALMFCPDIKSVLHNIKINLRNNGRLVIAVHGLEDEVPYFSSIMNSILKFIPDIRPDGTPTVHRFGNQDILQNLLEDSGFSNIIIKKYQFTYEAGTFEQYWNDYLGSTAYSLKPRIESIGYKTLQEIKLDSLKNTSRFIKNNKIIFPWTVLIASGVKKNN